LFSRFVSALHIPPTEPSLLISGGGDAELKVWDWLKGSLRWDLRIWEAVERFLIVKAVRRSGWGEEGGDGDGDGKVGKRKQKRKGKGKAERVGEAEGSDQENGVPATSLDGDIMKPTKVLVIQQIGSVVSSSTAYILFSAVGLAIPLFFLTDFNLPFWCSATALFAFPFRSGVQPSEILHFDFRKPILGFSVTENERAVVYLDGKWSDPEAETVPEDKLKYVRVLDIWSGQVKWSFSVYRFLLTSPCEVYRKYGI